MAKIFQKKYIRFAIAAILYILVVIWIGNYWLLLGLGIIFDLYITEKVNWTFWKKRHGANNTFIEWLDALIFAVIAVSLINIFLFQNYRIPTPSMEKVAACRRPSFCKQDRIWPKDAKHTHCIPVYAAYDADYKGQIMVKPGAVGLQTACRNWKSKAFGSYSF